MQEQRTIKLSQNSLEYTLDRGKRKNSYLCISGGKLLVKTSMKFPLKMVDKIILEKENWILNKLSQSEFSIKKQEFSYSDGEIIFILGEPYTLEILNVTGKNNVKIVDKMVVINLSKGHAKTAFETFIFELAKAEILESFDRMVKLTGLSPETVTVKKLTKSWGRCSSKGSISINRSLIFYPKKSMDYVVLHELCHRKHMNHSREFWGLVSSFMSDYLVHRNALK